jgi:hypothetical protein
VTAQREPAGEGAHEAAQQAASAATVAARWDTAGELPDTITELPGRAAWTAMPVQLSPVAADQPGPAGQASVAGQAGAAGIVDLPGGRREIRFPPPDGGPTGPTRPGLTPGAPPAAQRLASGPMAAARTAVAGTPGSAGARDGARGPAAARAHEPPLTLARSVVAAPVPAPVTAPEPVNRIVADAPAPAPAVQASRPAGGAAAISATPIVQRVDSAAPPAEGGQRGGQAHSETELDELAKALFGRIRTHLRTEVIHEREAKGLTFDAF